MNIDFGIAQKILIDVLCIFLLVFSHVKILGNKRFQYPHINAFIIANICANLFEIISTLYTGLNPQKSAAIMYVIENGYNCSAIIATGCWFINSLHVTESKAYKCRLAMFAIMLPLALSIILTVTTGLHHKVFYFDETLTYARGEWFIPFFSVAGLYIFAAMCIYISAEFNKEIFVFKSLNRIAAIYSVFLIICMAIQTVTHGMLSTINAAAAIVALMIYDDLQQKTITLDTLTSLPNRNSINEHLLSIIKKGKRNCYAVLFDIDSFKQINDKRGHLEGDAALKLVSKALRTAFADNAFYGRLGGDEFVILLEESSEEEASGVEDRLNDRLKVVLEEHKKPYVFTVSAGTAEIKENMKTIPDVLSVIDERMYIRKKLKKDHLRSRI